MKIQGPRGAERVMYIFTAWLTTSLTTKEHITASVYSYLSENAIIVIKKKEVHIYTKPGMPKFACDCNAARLKRDVNGRHCTVIH